MAILLSETKLDLLACYKCKISGSFWIEIEKVRYVLKRKYIECIQSASPMAPERKSISISHSAMSDSLWHHGLQPCRLLCSGNSPGKNIGVRSHSLLQGIFLTQGSNSGLLHWRQIIYCLSHQGMPSKSIHIVANGKSSFLFLVE